MPTKTPKQRDRETRIAGMRQRILDAALQLFVKLRYDDVTMRAIASAIGYSPGNLYYYFKNKEAVFAALRQEGFTKLHDAQMAARQSNDPRERLLSHARAFVQFALAHPEYYELMFVMTAPLPSGQKKDASSMASESFNLLVADTQLAVDAGVLPPARSTRRIALLLLSVLHGLVSLVQRGRVSHSSVESASELVNQTVDFLFEYAGLKPAPQTRSGHGNDRAESKA